MTLNIPSTSVRSKYLKRLPVGCIFVDPKSGYNYQVVEKQLNETLVKIAEPYLSSDKKPIELNEIPKEFLKLDSAPKANILKTMKIRLTELQLENKRLLENQNKSLYQRIKDNLNEKTYHETDDMYYCLHSGLVLPMKKKHHSSIEDALLVLDDSIDKIFKDSKILQKTVAKQHSIQSKLYYLLTCSNAQRDDDIKEILL
jgi:hypothetical protein